MFSLCIEGGGTILSILTIFCLLGNAQFSTHFSVTLQEYFCFVSKVGVDGWVVGGCWRVGIGGWMGAGAVGVGTGVGVVGRGEGVGGLVDCVGCWGSGLRWGWRLEWEKWGG